MQVLKIELKGVITSFRFPHLLIGRQPSYLMPPPSTIYGHIASALGEYPAPDGFRFAYTFTHAATVDDYEHTWLIKFDSRKNKKDRLPFNILANMNPTVREMLFEPRLTLYIDRPDWLESFRNPTYPVLLGRSQDLASYTKVEVLDLEQRTTGYFEHTLLPFEPWRLRLGQGSGLLMPRFIEPENRQNVTWARYVALSGRAFIPFAGEQTNDAGAGRFVRGLEAGAQFWVDPSSPEHDGRQRALEWLTVQGEGEALAF